MSTGSAGLLRSFESAIDTASRPPAKEPDWDRDYREGRSEISNLKSGEAAAPAVPCSLIPVPSSANSSPPSTCSGSGAPPLGGALPRGHGGREDATDSAPHSATPQDAASPLPGTADRIARHVAPWGAEWNGDPEAVEKPTPSSRFFIRATILADQLEDLRRFVDENRDVLSLREVAQGYQLIDEARRVSLHGLKDTPLTAIGARLDVRA